MCLIDEFIYNFQIFRKKKAIRFNNEIIDKKKSLLLIKHKNRGYF